MVSESKPWQVRDKYAVQTELKRWGLIEIKGIGEGKWKRKRGRERGEPNRDRGEEEEREVNGVSSFKEIKYCLPYMQV